MAYSIKIKFLGSVSTTFKSAVESAAKRWSKVIIGDLTQSRVTRDGDPFKGETIKNLAIAAKIKSIDRAGGILARAEPLSIRSDTNLPVTGIMEFDSQDIGDMERSGTLERVIMHEMGHVIGIGTLWEDLGLVKGLGAFNPVFIGKQAKQEYSNLKNSRRLLDIPVENIGGRGRFGRHWREKEFNGELMTGKGGSKSFLNNKAPLSRMTIASLADMGYMVDLNAADPYKLP